MNDSPTGAVLITGVATEDQTLTAGTASIADADGLGALSFQWSRTGSPIAGATASTYTLVQADVGSTITVTASYTDGQGTTESLTSSATSSVTGAIASPQTFVATADATIYENNRNNGSGCAVSLLAGRSGSGDPTMRALLRFDVSALSGATILTATVQLTQQLSAGGVPPFSLHFVTEPWTEGTESFIGGGSGVGSGPTGELVSSGGATWNRPKAGGALWNGGTFDASSSGNSTNATWSGSGLVADVQDWVNGVENNGWLLKATEEDLLFSARFFASREGNRVTRPMLIVSFARP